MTAEAALVTDERVSIPVQVLRNGLRLIAFGANTPGVIEVRYLEANADIKVGDTIVTSGGRPVPSRVAGGQGRPRSNATPLRFRARPGEPLAHPERYRHFLVPQVDVDQAESNRQEADVDGAD